VSNEQTQQADDPSGPGWRDVEPDEILQPGDMFDNRGRWERTGNPGITADEGRGGTYRRRIEPQQPSDSEPETMEDLRRRLAECEVLLAEAGGSGEQVNAELQQLREQVQTLTRERDEHARKLEFARESGEMSRRQLECEAGKVERLEEQVQTLTRERDRYRNQLAGAIGHSKAPEAQAQLVDRLQAWLRPVLEVVSDHPDHTSILAASVLEFLPQIASRLIEE
jgi:hypothetical protein